MSTLRTAAVTLTAALALTACGNSAPPGFESAWCELPQEQAIDVMLTKHQGFDASDGMTDEEWDAESPWTVDEYHEWLATYAACASDA